MEVGNIEASQEALQEVGPNFMMLVKTEEMIHKKAMRQIGLGVKKCLLQHRRKNLKRLKKHSRKCDQVM
jgi:hypothetical protein